MIVSGYRVYGPVEVIKSPPRKKYILTKSLVNKWMWCGSFSIPPDVEVRSISINAGVVPQKPSFPSEGSATESLPVIEIEGLGLIGSSSQAINSTSGAGISVSNSFNHTIHFEDPVIFDDFVTFYALKRAGAIDRTYAGFSAIIENPGIQRKRLINLPYQPYNAYSHITVYTDYTNIEAEYAFTGFFGITFNINQNINGIFRIIYHHTSQNNVYGTSFRITVVTDVGTINYISYNSTQNSYYYGNGVYSIYSTDTHGRPSFGSWYIFDVVADCIRLFNEAPTHITSISILYNDASGTGTALFSFYNNSYIEYW